MGVSTMSETSLVLEKPLIQEKGQKQTKQSAYENLVNQQKKHIEASQPVVRLRMKIALLLLICLPLLAYVGMVCAGYYLSDRAELNQLEAAIQSGRIIGQKGLPDRPAVRFQEMPAYVTDAIVAIEDHRFYLHGGIDPRGLARAAYVDLIRGKKAQGGSTITMQLARNLFLTQDKTFLRKGKEIAIALYLEQIFSKEQLLEIYVNQVYYGHGKYGIESAANFYFGKTVKKDKQGVAPINEKEAALLAGLLKSPETYSPVKNAGKAQQRQKIVLERMEELGKSSQTAGSAVSTNVAHVNH